MSKLTRVIVVQNLPYFKFNHCIHSSLHNITCDEYKDCKVVVGSLGFGSRFPFYEYGGKDYKVVSDFIHNGKMDLHCWLETPNGDVVDTFHYEYFCSCKVNKRQVKVNKNKKGVNVNVPFKLNYKFLKNQGLHYLPAPQSTQNILIKMLKLF